MLVAVIFIIFAGFVAGALLGAPFLPVLSQDIEPLLDLADLKSGQLLLDLGSGNGRLLKAAAKRGIRGYGYEINLWLHLAAKINCFRYRHLITLRLGNYWSAEWPAADAIYVFLITRYMKKMDARLAGLKRPTKVISYIFSLPEPRRIKQSHNAAVYRYP